MCHVKDKKSILIAMLLAVQVVAVLCVMCPCRLQAFEQYFTSATNQEASSQVPGSPKDCGGCSSFKNMASTSPRSTHQFVNPSCPTVVARFLPLELRCVAVAIFTPVFTPAPEIAELQVFRE